MLLFTLLLHFNRRKWAHIGYLRIGLTLPLRENFEPQKNAAAVLCWSFVKFQILSCPFINSVYAGSLTHLKFYFTFGGVWPPLCLGKEWLPNQGFCHQEAYLASHHTRCHRWVKRQNSSPNSQSSAPQDISVTCFMVICREGETLKSCIPWEKQLLQQSYPWNACRILSQTSGY